MGWTVSFQVQRDKPLSNAERKRLAEFSVERGRWEWDAERFALEIAAAARADAIVAHGQMKLSMDQESSDADQITSCLEDIVDVVPGARVLVEDDFGAFGNDALIELDGEGFVPAKELVPRQAPSQKPTDAAAMLARLIEIDDDEDRESAQLVRELAGFDGDEVLAAALRSYRELAQSWWLVGEPVGAAIERSGDLGQYAPAFLALWNEGGGTYWYGDLLSNMDGLIDPLTQVPEVEERMCADLDETSPAEEHERVCRRAEGAAEMLGRATSDRSLSALLRLLHRVRDVETSFDYDHHVVIATQKAVAERKDARAFPTLVLELDRMKSHRSGLSHAAHAIGAMAPSRAEPLLVRMAEQNIMPCDVAEGLAFGSSPEGEATLKKMLADPLEYVRRTAAGALTQRTGHEVTAPEVHWDPFEHFTHPRAEVRHEAMRAVADKKRKRDVLALALGAALDARLRSVIGDPGLPFSWYEWDKLPEDVVEMREDDLAAWALEHAAELAEQRVPACIQPLIDRGIDAVAADYPAPLFRLSAQERADLEREEQSVLATLASA